ncbi:MAG TPA: ABC transporter permease [Acidimicrobiales bacterium]|nr:ABC transporter permease [Acidimicrobiales bacterium]
MAAFRSEWVKLKRPNLLVGTYAGLALAASLFAILLFAQAPARGGGDLPSLAQLAQPNGLIHGVNRAAVLLGVVAFGIAATQIAGEYSLGTLRQLLVRQPRRAVLLAGKFLAVLAFMLGAVVFASLVATVAAFVMAHARHVPTGAWTSSAGITDLARALGDLLVATVGFTIFGLVVGLLFRSSVTAIIVGFAYLLPFEAVVTRIVPHTATWLPGQLLQAIATGGQEAAGFPRALILSAVYVVIAGVVATVVFVRRDVTA